MSAEGAYYLRRQPGAISFRAAWEAALDCGVRMLEDKVMERAIHGVEVPVVSCGKQFGTRRVYNERTAMLILQARLPEKYGMQRARAMSGLDKQVLARKKREWRREWEAEEAHKRKLAQIAARDEDDDEQEVLDSIDAHLDGMRERWLTGMSPRTRAAYDEYLRLAEEDKAAGYNSWEDPEHPSYANRAGAEDEDRAAISGPQGQPAAAANAAKPSDADASRPALEGENKNTPIPLPPPDWREPRPEAEEREPGAQAAKCPP